MFAVLLLLTVVVFQLIYAPYTKVEESFNIQACHDILYHGVNLENYDHQDYPGVVPRTFLGPLVVSGISLPFVKVFQLLGISKFFSQYVVRLALALLVILAWRRFHRQVKAAFGLSVSIWFTLITVSQFHFIYYLSRTLPNTFALVFALLAFSYWLEQDCKKFVITSGIGIIVFRIELVILLAPMLLHDVYFRVKVLKVFGWVLATGVCVLGLTVAVDSIFWGRLLWPEGEVFYFNSVLNKSHLWGTLPFLWYFYSALPRALGASIFLVPFGLYGDVRSRLFSAPALLFVSAFSFLPHKELRFIIYSLPIWNVVAATGCHFIWRNRTKSFYWMCLACGAALHLLCNVILTSLLLSVSVANYPGGAALSRLHQLVPSDFRLSVHIDNLAAQSGATRFLELNEQWRYNKTEDLKAGSAELRKFSHLLVEAKTKYAYNLKHYTDSHNVLEAMEAFSHITFNYQQFPPLKIRMKPALFILENLVDEDIEWRGPLERTEWMGEVEESGIEEKKEQESGKEDEKEKEYGKEDEVKKHEKEDLQLKENKGKNKKEKKIKKEQLEKENSDKIKLEKENKKNKKSQDNGSSKIKTKKSSKDSKKLDKKTNSEGR